MFNVGTGELLLIMVLALIVLGPDKLPTAARQAGRYLAEFRRISSGFQQEFRNAVDSAMNEADRNGSGSDRLGGIDNLAAFDTIGEYQGLDGIGSGTGSFSLPQLEVDVAPELAGDDWSAPAPDPDPGPASSPVSLAKAHVEVDGPSGSFL
jgi:sec-independent protein translocase protein TatB